MNIERPELGSLGLILTLSRKKPVRSHTVVLQDLGDRTSISIDIISSLFLWLIKRRVNSKATLRIHMKDVLPLIPKLLHTGIKGSRYYAANSESLVIQSDDNRNRMDNVQECYKKLHAMIVAAAKATVRGETSPEKAERVKNL